MVLIIRAHPSTLRLIFAAMQKKPAIFFLLIGVAIALAGFTIKQTTPAPVYSGPQEQVLQLHKLPNAELERQQSPSCTIGFTAEKRHVSFLEQPRPQVRSHALVNIALLSGGVTASPHKDYLFHIYPTHHFW